MGNVNYTPLYDKFPDSKYKTDERWNYNKSGMTAQQIDARDREVSRDIKRENTHKIHYKKRYKNLTDMDGSIQGRICIGDGDFEFGECCGCGKKWFKEDQEICEGCGVALSRM